eukprot:TRINITY_DN48837_c0_g1_i1.p1 TRINITY_DN48837_c0_g1~~TRINITY_DN48837_c0_g1_i1.p1  ORF type:complete len:961 (+),score=149.45 TRINITY_DN48837_c0_g1_i1:71-2953(+)
MPRPPQRRKNPSDVSNTARTLLARFDVEELGHLVQAIFDAHPMLSVPSSSRPQAKELDLATAESGPMGKESAMVVPNVGQQPLDAAPGSRPPVDATPVSLVQFSSSIFYCSEDDGTVEIEVIRLGPKEKACTVEYETVDASAKAGLKYRHAQGVLKFNPGEAMKKVFVELINNPRWDATLEFTMHLSGEEGTELGRYLRHCRVRIADTDVFPAKCFNAQVKEEKFEEIPKISLLKEYFKMNLKYGRIARKVFVVTLFKLIDNILVIATMVLRIYIFDFLMNTTQNRLEAERRGESLEAIEKQTNQAVLELICISSLTLLVVVLNVASSTCMVNARVAGECRSLLQTNIVRKFLNYEHKVRLDVREADVIMAITRDSPSLVAKGFMSLTDLFKQVTLLGLLLIFQIWNSYRSADEEISVDFAVYVLPSVTFPVCMVTFLRMRQSKTSKANLRVDIEVTALSRRVERIVQNVKLVVGFQQRATAIQGIDEQVKALNARFTERDLRHTLNTSFGPTLAALIFVVYSVYAGRKCVTGDLTVGQVLSQMDALKLTSSAWNDLYATLLVMQASYPALEHIVRYMNLPVDLARRMQLHRQNREMNLQAWEEARGHRSTQADGNVSPIALDTIPLQIQKVTYAFGGGSDSFFSGLREYSQEHFGDSEAAQLMQLTKDFTKGTTQFGQVGFQVVKQHAGRLEDKVGINLTKRISALMTTEGGGSEEQADSTLDLALDDDLVKQIEAGIHGSHVGPWSVELRQGILHAFVGKHGHGKGTLLSIAAGMLLQDAGHCFIPPHLRVYFVPHDPLFLDSSLYENLTFGTDTSNEKDACMERVLAICRKLHIPEHIMGMIQARSDSVGLGMLSLSEKTQLQLVRALVANPEVLVLHKPTCHFTDAHTALVLRAFKEHVQQRGLEMEEPWWVRRPRTVLFTAIRPQDVQAADEIYLVRKDSVTNIAACDVEDQMLN